MYEDGLEIRRREEFSSAAVAKLRRCFSFLWRRRTRENRRYSEGRRRWSRRPLILMNVTLRVGYGT